MCSGVLTGEEELKVRICEVMRNVYLRGLVSALEGNVSARVPGSNEFWITPSATFKGGVRPEDLVKLDTEGNVVYGIRKPSSEWRAHASIYKVRPDVNAVVHTHNPVTVGLIEAGYKLQPVSIEATIIIKKVEVVPYADPGSRELAEFVAEKAGTGARALILRKHGVLALGSDLYDAEAIAEGLEEVSKIQFIKLSLNSWGHHGGRSDY